MRLLAIDVGLVEISSTPLQLLLVLLVLGVVGAALISLVPLVLSRWVDRRWPATEPLDPTEMLWAEVGGYVQRTFRGLGLEQARDIVAHMTEVKVPAGTDIVEQGDPANHFYILKSGEAEVLQRFAAPGQAVSREEVIRRFGPGDSFGEVAILRRAARTATVRAVTDCVVLRLPAEDFVAVAALSAAGESDLLAVVDRYLAEDRARVEAVANAAAHGPSSALRPEEGEADVTGGGPEPAGPPTGPPARTAPAWSRPPPAEEGEPEDAGDEPPAPTPPPVRTTTGVVGRRRR